MVDDFLNISNANSELSVNGDSFEYSYMFLRIVAVSIFILGNTQQTFLFVKLDCSFGET